MIAILEAALFMLLQDGGGALQTKNETTTAAVEELPASPRANEKRQLNMGAVPRLRL